MIWLEPTEILTTLRDILMLRRRSEREKDTESLLLHQQLRIVERKERRAYRLSQGEKRENVQGDQLTIQRNDQVW